MSVTCGLDFERRLSASSFDVRRSISEAVRELGFEITVDQLTRIEARRGGMLGYSMLIKKQMPIRAVFEVSADGAGSLVAGHLTDNVRNLGKTWGMNGRFREIFEEVQGRVDRGLERLDTPAARSFAEPRFWSRAADIGVLEQTNALTAKAVGGAVGTAGKMLGGEKDATPKAWKGVDSVTFSSSAGEAVLTLAETQADLGIAVLVVSHPGAMPANLTRDVETFAAAVEQKLTAAGGGAARVEVADAQMPVLEFLHQQARIRSELPMRELHICRSCRLEKITNPEYERIAVRNEKIGDLVAGVGATISKGGISPTFVLGQVFKLKRLDPQYVCSRCQGMEADERIVTFCPSCADLQRDVVLRLCHKCGFDFRTEAGKVSLWATAAEPQGATEPANEPTTPEPAEPAAEPIVGSAGAPAPEQAEAAPEITPATAIGQALEPAAEPVAEPTKAPEPAPAPEIGEPLEPALEPAVPPRPEPAIAAVPEPITEPELSQRTDLPAETGPADDMATPLPPQPSAVPAPPPLAATAQTAPPPSAAASFAPPPAAAVPPAPPSRAPLPAPPFPGTAAPFQPWPPVAWPHPAQVPLGRPQVGRRGKVCQMCRREYPDLWRVVIATPAGFEERFLCGTTVTCQMPSLVRAVKV